MSAQSPKLWVLYEILTISHAHFSEVTGMIFVEVGPVMMLPTRHTTSTRMLSVLANAAVTSGDMAATGQKEYVSYVRTLRLPQDLLFTGFGQSRRHCCHRVMIDVLGALEW